MEIYLSEKETQNIKKMAEDIEDLDNSDYHRPEQNTVETAIQLARKMEEQE